MRIVLQLLLVAALTASVSCNKSSPQPATTLPQQATPTAKHYQLKGKIVSIDKRAKMADIDAEAIPGFMDAMTMPYPIKPESDLDKLHPGDLITADLVVQDDDSWLEKVIVASHSADAHK